MDFARAVKEGVKELFVGGKAAHSDWLEEPWDRQAGTRDLEALVDVEVVD